MVTIELNEYSAEDVKMIETLKAMGLDEKVIQMAYNETQRRRREEEMKNEV